MCTENGGENPKSGGELTDNLLIRKNESFLTRPLCYFSVILAIFYCPLELF